MKKITLLLGFLLLLISVKAQVLVNQNFNGVTSMPTGWIPFSSSGTHEWQVGLTNTINGHDLTGSVAFDDDAAGNTGVVNTASILTPSFDISPYINDPNLRLNVFYNFFFDTVDTDDALTVSLYSPTAGTYDIKTYDADIQGVTEEYILFTNPVMQNYQSNDTRIAVTYDDVNASWGWGAGIYSIRVSVNPTNDYYAIPIALSVGNYFNDQVYIANNFGATNNIINNPPINCGNGNETKDIWFKVIIPPSGHVIIETDEQPNSNMTDTVIGVYDGNFGNLNEIVCNDDKDTNSTFSKVELSGRTPGETLYIRVFGYSDNYFGEFKISAYDLHYDNCATPLYYGAGYTFDDSYGIINNTDTTASGEQPLPDCIPANLASEPDVWVSVVVPNTGNLTIETRDVSNSPVDYAAIAAYSGSCGALTQIGCSDSGSTVNPNFSILQLTGLNPGDTILIRVIAFGPIVNGVHQQGEFKLATYDPTPPTNDICGTAWNISSIFTSGPYGNNEDATNATGGQLTICNDGSDNGMNDGVWFKFTAQDSGDVQITVDTTGWFPWDAQIGVYSGDCSNLICEGATDALQGVGGVETITVAVTNGTTYYVNVGQSDATTDNSEGFFTIDAQFNPTNAIGENEISGLELFPNPFTEVVHFKSQELIRKVTVYNQIGKVVKITEPGTTNFQVNLKDLTSGIYLFKIEAKNNKNSFKKVIKQ